MNHVANQDEVEGKIISIQGAHVLLDSDVTELYGVETKRINEAVKNNPDKFPEGYWIELTGQEKKELVENFDRFNVLKHSTVLPKAFTEKWLYMLATILKSEKTTETTLRIIETFAKVREVSKIINQIPTLKEDHPEHQKLMQRAGEIISDLVVPESLETDKTEASIELNLALVKFKYSVKRKAK